MPKKVIDYSKCIIYKIVCKDFNIKDLYVGHTTDFTKRKYYHKNYSNKPEKSNMKIYKIINNNGGWLNWSMIVIETFIECRNANEARARERFWFEELSANMNSYIPILTDDEKVQKLKVIQLKYYNANKDQIAEQKKEYYDNNKEKFSEYSKNYRKINEDEIKENRLKNKEKMIEYYKIYRQVNDINIKDNKIKNFEKNKLYMKEYYKKNKQKMLYDRRIDCKCTCGSHYFLYAKSSHEKTNKHINFMNSQNVEIKNI